MRLNSLHMRIGGIAAGVVLFIGYSLFGGSMGPRTVIQVDFSMEPDLFEGLEVEIDGNVVGRLDRYGQVARSGFDVDEGRHTIRVLHPEFASEPVTLALEHPGQKARLALQIGERYDASGRSTPTLFLQY